MLIYHQWSSVVFTPPDNFTGHAQDIYSSYVFEKLLNLRLHPHLPGVNESISPCTIPAASFVCAKLDSRDRDVQWYKAPDIQVHSGEILGVAWLQPGSLWLIRDQTLSHIGPWWCQDMESLSALLALCEGNLLEIGGFPSQKCLEYRMGLF